MAAEVAEVATAVAAQQAEVDDDPASGEFVAVAGGFARNCGLIFSFVIGRHARPIQDLLDTKGETRPEDRSAPHHPNHKFSRYERRRKARHARRFACRLCWR